MSSLLPSAVVLGLAALAALGLVRARWPPVPSTAVRSAAARALAIALGLQCVHFVEEASTGFPRRLGELVGLPAMSFSFFAAFNLLWIVFWTVSLRGLRTGRRDAYFAAWFLAIAGAVNGLAHPLLALASRGYFPGLVSAPLAAAGSLWLGRQLVRATSA